MNNCNNCPHFTHVSSMRESHTKLQTHAGLRTYPVGCSQDSLSANLQNVGKDGKRDGQFDITWHNLTTLPQRRANWNKKFNCIHPLVIKHGRNITIFIIRLGWGRIGWGSNVHEIYSITCTGCYARIDIPMVRCMDFTKCMYVCICVCMCVCVYVCMYVCMYVM